MHNQGIGLHIHRSRCSIGNTFLWAFLTPTLIPHPYQGAIVVFWQVYIQLGLDSPGSYSGRSYTLPICKGDCNLALTSALCPHTRNLILSRGLDSFRTLGLSFKIQCSRRSCDSIDLIDLRLVGLFQWGVCSSNDPRPGTVETSRMRSISAYLPGLHYMQVMHNN